MCIWRKFYWPGGGLVMLALLLIVTPPARAATQAATLTYAAVRQRLTLGETSVSGPSLWTPTTGVQPPANSGATVPAGLLAWAGTDPAHSINILNSSDGLHYNDKLTLHEYTTMTPDIIDVITTNKAGEAWIVAWTGTDANHSLNILYDVTSVTGARHKLTLPASSSFAPSIAQFNDQIWLAWADTSSQHRVHVQPLGPLGLTPGAPITLDYSSLGAPMLVNDVTNHQLLLSWTDTGQSSYLPNALPYINFVASADGAQWHTVLPAPAPQLSNAGPALLSAPNSVYAWSWTGTDPLHSLNLATTTTVNNWPAPITTFDEQSFGSPALGLSGANIVIGWTGVDPAHHLNIAIAAPASSPPPTPVSTPAATPTAVPVGTPIPCSAIGPIQASYQDVPLPPQTHVGRGNGATGEIYTVLCSDTGTSESIDQFMATALPQAGWHMYDPSKDVNEGCAYVNWVKGTIAMDWGFGALAIGGTFSKSGSPSSWFVATCTRMNPPPGHA